MTKFAFTDVASSMVRKWSEKRDAQKIDSTPYSAEPKLQTKQYELAYHWNRLKKKVIVKKTNQLSNYYVSSSKSIKQISTQSIKNYNEASDN